MAEWASWLEVGAILGQLDYVFMQRFVLGLVL